MNRILVRIPQWLGDAVVSTVFLKRLRELHPEAWIAVLAAKHLSEIFTGFPTVNETRRYDRTQGLRMTVSEITSGHYDTLYVLPRSLRTGLEAVLSKIPVRIGFSNGLRNILFTETVAYNPHQKYSSRYLSLLNGQENGAEVPSPYFPTADIPKEKEQQLFGSSWAELPKPVFGIAPASIAPARTWDVNRFREVAQLFLERTRGTVIIFGSAREQSVTARCRSGLQGSVIDTAGKLTLPELGSVFSRLNGLVANDSGLMHVASCFGVPTMVVFGASDPTYAVPQSGQFEVVQKKVFPCVPCLRNQCVRLGAEHNGCLKAAKVADLSPFFDRFTSK